ncbi:MAG: branched-chain amino acid transaminase [Candidatus Aminicenantes bacterium]
MDWPDLTVHSMSHALHYGTSVFEGIRAYSTANGPAVFRLPEHLDRFFHSASVLAMDVPYTKEEITRAITLVIKENQLDSAYIRPLLYYAYGNLGLLPKTSPVELVIAAWEWGAYLGEAGEKGVSVYILPNRRIHHSQFDMKAKLGGVYVLSTLGGQLARSRGFDEAVYLNIEGNIAEGPGENIFIVKNGILKTNDVTESILEGITRASILEFAGELGIETTVGSITMEEFVQADEAFFSGTAVEIASIIKVTDGSDSKDSEKTYTIGTGEKGEVTQKIQKHFNRIVRGESEGYRAWLTYVYS